MQLLAIQSDIAWEDREANHRQVRELLAGEAVRPGALVVLPEMFASGFSMNVPAIHEGDDRPSERFLGELAREHRACVIGGTVRCGPDGLGRNQAVAFGAEGQELARYTKMHPLTIAGEAAVYRRGERVTAFEWGGATVSPLICYDLRFPERFREAVDLGATVLAVIANFPVQRESHWLALLTARAIENQAYVVGVNRCGQDPNHAYTGRSRIIDPRGRVLADAGTTPGVIAADADFDDLERYRTEFPALKDRCPR